MSVIAGVTVSDCIVEGLESAFSSFISRLDKGELINGEPKGSLMSPEHRAEFCEMLVPFDGVQVCPTTLDLSHVVIAGREAMIEETARRLRVHAERHRYEEARQRLGLPARQVANLSLPQLLRLFSLTANFYEVLHHSILFLSHDQHRDSWEEVRFEIDRAQVRAGSREERVMSTMLFAWLQAHSSDRPFPMLRGIHTPDHPFVSKYDLGVGIDMTTLVQRNLHWVDSRNNWGIQCADIAAFIVYNAATNPGDEEAVETFGALMKSSPYGSARGPGLITPLLTYPYPTAPRLKPLSDIMDAKKSGP